MSENTPGADGLPTQDGNAPLNGGGTQRTTIDCHSCSKNFVAELDLDINGDYVIECPHCLHEHCRTVKDGLITEGRWSGRNTSATTVRGRRSAWRRPKVTSKDGTKVVAGAASTIAEHIRERWLNRSDYDGL